MMAKSISRRDMAAGLITGHELVRYSGDLADPGRRDALHLEMRSFLGTLFYLSQAIDVPALHAEEVLRSEEGLVG